MYESETFISGVYFGGEARHEVHRVPNARLTNKQKRNRQILDEFSFSIDLGSELDSEGGPKMSDDKNLWKSASNCLRGHHIQFLGQSMKICGNELSFLSGGGGWGGKSASPPPHSAGLGLRTLR